MRTLKDLKSLSENTHKLILKEGMAITNMNISQLAGGLGVARGTIYKYLIKYYGKNFQDRLRRELMIATNTAEDVAKITLEN